jgi:hypothetical protein
MGLIPVLPPHPDPNGKALFTTMGIPWILCFTAYTCLHWTYSADKEAIAPFIDADTPRHTTRQRGEEMELVDLQDPAEDEPASADEPYDRDHKLYPQPEQNDDDVQAPDDAEAERRTSGPRQRAVQKTEGETENLV